MLYPPPERLKVDVDPKARRRSQAHGDGNENGGTNIYTYTWIHGRYVFVATTDMYSLEDVMDVYMCGCQVWCKKE